MEEVIAVVVFEVHLVTGVKGWVVDSAATRHIGAFREDFISYSIGGRHRKCICRGQ